MARRARPLIEENEWGISGIDRKAQERSAKVMAVESIAGRACPAAAGPHNGSVGKMSYHFAARSR
jgi:hypothetical protein